MNVVETVTFDTSVKILADFTRFVASPQLEVLILMIPFSFLR